jgi:hypothetical protein
VTARVKKFTDEAFWSMVDKSGDCWLWTGVIYKRTGYGSVGRRGSAHRLAYILVVGPIPNGMHLDHLCRVRHCVNPDHLEPVTPRENLLRGETHAARNAAKTQCFKGHELSGDNLRVNTWKNKDGEIRFRRKCRACAKEESAASYLKRKARVATKAESD